MFPSLRVGGEFGRWSMLYLLPCWNEASLMQTEKCKRKGCQCTDFHAGSGATTDGLSSKRQQEVARGIRALRKSGTMHSSMKTGEEETV